MKKLYVGAVLMSLLAIASCGSSSSSSNGGGTTADTVTISGTLATTTNADIAAAKASGSPLKTAAAAGYKLHCIDLTKNSQDYIDADSSGAFSFTVDGGDSVACDVLNSEYSQEGIAVFGNSGSSIAYTGLSTTGTGSTLDLGTVTLNTDTNAATPGNDVSGHADSGSGCTAVNWIPIGADAHGALTTGIDATTKRDRANDGDGTGDEDGDCARDIRDVDDDNDGTLDDQAGVKYSGCPGIAFITLFINNQRQVTNPDAAPERTDYMLTQHVTPAEGYTINSVTVTGPSYLDDLTVVDSDFYDTPITADTPWDKTLVPCEQAGTGGVEPNNCIFLNTSPTATINLAERIAQGDQFVYDAAFTDGTSVTCTRTINSVIDKVVKNVRVCDDSVAAASCTTSFTGGWMPLSTIDANANSKIKLVFEIPAGMQKGFTYRFDISTYEQSGGTCTPGTMFLPDMVAVDPTFTGDQRAAATEAQVNTEVIVDWTSANWPASSINAWLITLTAYDAVNDNSKLSGIGAYAGGTNLCPSN